MKEWKQKKNRRIWTEIGKKPFSAKPFLLITKLNLTWEFSLRQPKFVPPKSPSVEQFETRTVGNVIFFTSLKTTLSSKYLTGVQLSFLSLVLRLEECLNCKCDSLSVTHPYRYPWWSKTCGQYSPDYLNYLHRFQGQKSASVRGIQNLYLRLKTDDSIHLSGINISFIVGSYNRKSLLRSYYV